MIYLVRHGESEANIQKRYSGITDVDLSQHGRFQARQAGKILTSKKISHVYSSPLKRAMDTAKIICNEIDCDKSKIIAEACLIEVNFGIFENMTWDEIRLNFREETENWIMKKHKYKFPEGEDYKDIIKRISSFMEKVPDNSLIVTHFGVIQSILLYLGIADDLTLWNFKISNCDILVLNKNKFYEIIRINSKTIEL